MKLPEQDLSKRNTEQASVLQTAGQGLRYLRENRGILDLILFLACINLVASVYNAALPAMLLSRDGGSQAALALVSTCTGLANVTGSVIATFLPAPKSRVRAICLSLLFSMSTENFLLALGRGTPVWCLGAILGWLFIPVMNTNMDALFRTHIPVEMQGRVYSARNTLQFFTIPVGYLLGGVLVDQVFEPLWQTRIRTASRLSCLAQERGQAQLSVLCDRICGHTGMSVFPEGQTYLEAGGQKKRLNLHQ